MARKPNYSFERQERDRADAKKAAEKAAAGRHADHHRAGEVAGRAVAQARRLRDDLVIGRIHVVGELDLDAGAQAIGRHADRGADDADSQLVAEVAKEYRLLTEVLETLESTFAVTRPGVKP